MKLCRINSAIVRLMDKDEKTLAMPSHIPHAASMLLAVLNANEPDKMDAAKKGLPFQPLSYRDFMLFPAHYAGAAAGIGALWLKQKGFPISGTLVAWTAWLWHKTTGTFLFPFGPSRIYKRQPIFYQGNHLSIVASGTPVAKPPYCERYLDVELELGVIIGQELYNAGSPNEALGAIAGFCVLNDFSARDVQWREMRSGFGPQLCKSFASAISSEVVSADEIYQLLPVNSTNPIAEAEGKYSRTGNFTPAPRPRHRQRQPRRRFTLGEALMHASQGTKLYPGELFGSGTWPGGAGIEYLSWSVKVGDTVTLEIDGVGSVTNQIVEEPQDRPAYQNF
ncbi:hypothetical protein PG984_013773 [Apiospora sp. TS-2023a]